MKKILNRLFQHERLSREEARDVLNRIAAGEYNEAQLAAFLTVYLMRAMSVEELGGFRAALLDVCIPLNVSDFDAIDLCGTGGDAKNTFNISTLASFVVAGAGGKVVKHGNYGVSSLCGSSNVMEWLGYRFSNDASKLRRELDEAGICFLHAPLFHPALKNVAPVRKALGVRTFFNMLGPLVNPARPRRQCTGVFSFELARIYQYLLQEADETFAVVHSLDGYDEISLTAPAKCLTNKGERLLSPADFESETVSPAALFGGDTVEEAGHLFLRVLENRGTEAQQNVVLANAALALQCLSPEKSLGECRQVAAESLTSGLAMTALKRLVDLQ
ncbi:MAG: anthranilate phosphoribosyltransferase [Bacteroidota bacterium]